MTQEHKELLIKDLCARLSYGVKCKDININVIGTLSQIGLHCISYEGNEHLLGTNNEPDDF